MKREMAKQICEKLSEMTGTKFRFWKGSEGYMATWYNMRYKVSLEIFDSGELYVCGSFSIQLADPDCFERLAEVLVICGKHRMCDEPSSVCRYWKSERI